MNNMENQIRDNAHELLRPYYNNDSKRIEVENGIFNYTIQIAIKKDIRCDWKNTDFTKIYYNKLTATISIIMSARRLEFEGVNIYG